MDQLSRDITALSKKLIFVLHREALSSAPADVRFKEARQKEADILKLFVKVGAEFAPPPAPAPPAAASAEGEGDVAISPAEAGTPAPKPDLFWRFENNVCVDRSPHERAPSGC